MPWCEECNKFQADSDLDEAGACLECGAVIGEPPKVPWHFKLLVVALVIYLGWRFVQGVGWVMGKF